MKNQQQNDMFANLSTRDAMNAFSIASNVLMYFVIPFTHRGFGTRAFQYCGPFAFIAMFLAAGVVERPDLLMYIPIWTLAVLYRRVTADRDAHSRCFGYPHFLRVFGHQAYYVEGALFLGVGYLMQSPLGLLLMAIGTSIISVILLDDMSVNARIQDMRDAEKTHRDLNARYRERGR